ncbi:MAG: ATP-binding cassette domain-containing protein [Clostridiales bacterium]
MSEIIKIENLNKTFKSKQNTVVALDDINIAVEAGEIFGIIGLSGAGKSTLVRCMNFLERPTQGKVIFDGNDLSALTSKQLLKARQSMSMIFQQFNLLMQKTTMQNICFPMSIAGISKADAKKRAVELLEIVGLTDKANAYPAQLSGGQKQRVAIARALATNPKVLLCDEATSALDPTTTRSILDLLKKINRELGITIVIITHEMTVIEEICQRVAIIDDSHIVELGKVSDVFLEPKSDMAKQLIFPGAKKVESFVGGKSLRLVFDGDSFTEPVIGNMVLECGAPVNILFADIEKIDGKTYGQMLIELPKQEHQVKRIYAYLRVNKIHFEEGNK